MNARLPALAPGARIAVVAPAGIYAQDRLWRGMDVLRSWGYTPVEAPNLAATHRYTAGTVEQRAADLIWALTDPTIGAVWYARGGFGTAHLLPLVPWDRLDGRPVLGFSDATALLTALHQRGHIAIHAPVLQGLSDDAFGASGAVLVDELSRQSLRALLHTGTGTTLPGRLLCGPQESVRGPLIGGNLAVLASLCGTPWQIQPAKSVLLLEDVGEAPYRLDRLLTQMHQAGALADVAGIALGDFLETRASTEELEATLRDLLEPLGIPVVIGLPVGHGSRNLAFVLGSSGLLSGAGWCPDPPTG